ncbi:MAG: GerW family sporulation protein [Sporomusaceae bacterium]|nr:GerW family sporulation protein [Sporomusaceae bacterium]
MSEHPIQSMMKTTMESIKEMVDVNTIVGEPVETPDGTVIIPISRVTFGFAAGGGDYPCDREAQTYPYGGGSGAGVSVKPVGFLVCTAANGVRFMPVECNFLYDRMVDLVPQVFTKMQELFGACKQDKDELDKLADTAETQAH